MSRRRLGLALLAGGGAFFAGSYFAARALSRRLISAEGLGPTTTRREDLLDALRESGASVHDFRYPGSARDPVTLAAIFASPEARTPPGATILFLHGKGGNSAEWQPDALRALSLGYDVLLPDLRGHAPSGGDFVTYGFLEKEDLANAVAHARSRFGLDPERLGVHACSAGSTVALEFAAGRPGIHAVWIESPWADAREMARHYLSVATGLPPWMLDLTTRLAVRRALGRIRRDLGLPPGDGDLARVDPMRSLTEVQGRVCLVYGDRDELVPPRFARRLEACLPPGSVVWRADGAGHCHHDDEAEKVTPDEYGRRWTEFFRENLPVEG
jgi:pimeloyl-ACP methyl ester carboxylesterase